MVDVAFELILHEVIGEFPGVAETLQPAVHVAGVTQILKPHNASLSPVVLLLKIVLLEGDRSPPEMFLLQLALGLVVLPILLETVHITVLDDLALAELQLTCLVALPVPTPILPSNRRIIALRYHIQILFSNRINFLEDLSLSDLPCFVIIAADDATAPADFELLLESLPVLLLADLNPNKLFLNCLVSVIPSNEDPFEVDFGEDLMGLVDVGDIEPFGLDTPVLLLEVEPASFGDHEVIDG